MMSALIEPKTSPARTITVPVGNIDGFQHGASAVISPMRPCSFDHHLIPHGDLLVLQSE
jgi:hypothetical protein